MIKLGLRIRFFLYSNTVIAVTMILVTVFGMMYQRRVLYDGIVERGVSLAEAMAIPVPDAMTRDASSNVTNELIARYEAEIMARNQGFVQLVAET